MVQGKILSLKAKINLSFGKTDQAIRRKGKKNLTERELLRRYLKSPRGKSFLHDLKEQYSKMVADPAGYILKERLKNLEHNNKLKFSLLKELKYYKLKDFTLDPASRFGLSPDLFSKTVSASGKAGALSNYKIKKGQELKQGVMSLSEVEIKNIPSIRDRAVFVFFNLIMENYMEPLGDPHSFGFRAGRDSLQAGSVVANKVGVTSCHTFGQAANATMGLSQRGDKHIINVELNESAFQLLGSGLSKTKDKACSVGGNISHE